MTYQRYAPANDVAPVLPPASHIGRIMFWAQWFTPCFTMLMLIYGRMLYGQSVGIASVIAFYIIALPVVVVGFIGCALTLIPTANRRRRALPQLAAWCNLALWPLTMIWCLFIDDYTGDQTGHDESVAQRITGATATTVWAFAFWIAIVMLVVYFIYLVAALACAPRVPKTTVPIPNLHSGPAPWQQPNASFPASGQYPAPPPEGPQSPGGPPPVHPYR